MRLRLKATVKRVLKPGDWVIFKFLGPSQEDWFPDIYNEISDLEAHDGQLARVEVNFGPEDPDNSSPEEGSYDIRFDDGYRAVGIPPTNLEEVRI